MRNYQSTTYFDTQSSALTYVEEEMQKSQIQIQYPENIWTEHVSYGTTVTYHFQLKNKSGNFMKKWLHISLYRMDNGKYELTYYKS